ncbi:MAG: hypothetical protein VXW58_06505 [Pseudomonadota bacterium]|nr:hypothetical protein [Pseudomonadota bacterium]
MRHIFVIIALIATAWAFLPGAVQAHEMPHAEMGAATMGRACDACPGMDETGGHTSGVECHHSAGCGAALLALPVSQSVTADPAITRGVRPQDAIGLRSVTLSGNLPPPRS